MSAETKFLAVEQLQRVLLPKRGEPRDVRMLYLIESEQNPARARWDSRTAVTIPEGCEVSFQTYFNAFPASYWRRWSQLDSVVLRLEMDGDARIDVYRSKIDGARIAVDGGLSEGGVIEFECSLAPFEDGGWLWFDVTSDSEVTITKAGWYAPCAPQPQVMPDGALVEVDRAELVALTPEGRERLEALRRAFVRGMREQFTDWDAETATRAARLLEEISDHIVLTPDLVDSQTHAKDPHD